MQWPENYAETPEGLLFIADGFHPMTRWDGVSATEYPVGVTAPQSAVTLSAGGTGTITGTYYGFVRYLNERGAWSDLSPVSAACVANHAGVITYAGVPYPTQANVTSMQLLRNTSGQAQTFYVDVTTTRLYDGSYSSTRADANLASQQAVPLFDAQFNPLANTNGVPPAHKCVIASHLGRMFASVQRDYNRGSVVTVNGSTTVQGFNTDWTTSLAGRYLYVVGATQPYQIGSVDQANQVLTLATPYQDQSDNFAVYAVRPAPAERRLVYYTQAGLSESWPAFYALALQEDGDEITGLISQGSFLYILERRHVYRFTFQTDPALDGFVFLASNRGCVNQRCVVLVDDSSYMLDQSGVHVFDGGTSTPVSTPIQRIFQPYDSDVRLNWDASDRWHAIHSPGEEVVRWFVTLSGQYLPMHALAFDYRNKRWWVEEFQRPVSCSATLNQNGCRRVFLGGDGNRTFLYAADRLDGPDSTSGDTRGLVTAATPHTLTDAQASWPTQGLLGHAVTIVSGTGRGQSRVICGVQGQTLSTRDPWLVLPDATSVYQLGGIPWTYQSGWFRWLPDEETNPRRVEVVYEPTQHPATLAVQVFKDFSGNPVVWRKTQTARESEGMGIQAGQPDLEVDLTYPSGLAQQRMDGHKELYARGGRYVAVQLSGVSSRDFQAVYQLSIDGAAQG